MQGQPLEIKEQHFLVQSLALLFPIQTKNKSTQVEYLASNNSAYTSKHDRDKDGLACER